MRIWTLQKVIFLQLGEKGLVEYKAVPTCSDPHPGTASISTPEQTPCEAITICGSRAVYEGNKFEFQAARSIRDGLLLVIGGRSIHLLPKCLDQEPR